MRLTRAGVSTHPPALGTTNQGERLISLLLPTRQRPHNLKRLVDSIHATASRPEEIELVTRHDSDDDTYDDLDLDIEWIKIGGPRGIANLSTFWNDCYASCSGEIIMHCGDDIVFRTFAWDTVVRDAFDETPDNILFAYGYDGIQPRDFGTHGFVHRKWIETVGYLFPPLFQSDYNDCFLNDVAKLVDRHLFIDIYTEHLHFCANKASIDQNTADRLARHAESRPDILYASDEVQNMIVEAAEKLRGAMP